MLDFKTGFYENLFKSLDNNAVIMRVEDDGRYYPVWCSREFTEMIEGTEEEFISVESGGSMETIFPDDRDEIAYLFRNHVARDGSNSVTVRKYTLKGNLLWVCIHYAFMLEDGVQYAYCTYFNVTDLKESERQTQAMYEGLNRELHTLANESLCVVRCNLTEGVVEEIRGKDSTKATERACRCMRCSGRASTICRWTKTAKMSGKRSRWTTCGSSLIRGKARFRLWSFPIGARVDSVSCAVRCPCARTP